MTAKVKIERLLKIPHVARHGAACLWLREILSGFLVLDKKPPGIKEENTQGLRED